MEIALRVEACMFSSPSWDARKSVRSKVDIKPSAMVTMGPSSRQLEALNLIPRAKIMQFFVAYFSGNEVTETRSSGCL